MPEQQQARVVEITVWLNSLRRVRVRADTRITKDPGGDEVNMRRSGSAATNPELEQLALQVLKKLVTAFPDEQQQSIDLLVDDNGAILPDP